LKDFGEQSRQLEISDKISFRDVLPIKLLSLI
jgi:hypothetical protein